MIALLATTGPIANAQLEIGSGSLLDSCAKIDALQKAGQFAEARTEANQCLQGIEQQVQGEVGKFFTTEIADWKRTAYDENTVLGFANITATYKQGEVSAEVSLTRGAGGSDSVGAGLGKLLGGLAKAGLAETGRKVRVAGLPASVQQDGSIVVTLDDGAFLSFKSQSLTDADSSLAGLGSLVNAFPVADINKTLSKK